MMMTKNEAITKIIERMAANEDAATDLLNALMEFPDLVAENPKVTMAMINLVSVRMESGRVIEEARQVLDDGD